MTKRPKTQKLKFEEAFPVNTIKNVKLLPVRCRFRFSPPDRISRLSWIDLTTTAIRKSPSLGGWHEDISAMRLCGGSKESSQFRPSLNLIQRTSKLASK